MKLLQNCRVKVLMLSSKCCGYCLASDRMFDVVSQTGAWYLNQTCLILCNKKYNIMVVISHIHVGCISQQFCLHDIFIHGF